ncbi:hypothetical protein G210_1749 [Candida maltosa Xu316]|uniref:FHA domain-containing protein n=1 Tax=Candida maltosa (strain Xu316) TaxID=1245528 RepID=M3J6U8_CANMX|nr:hypothetical protein G210_1749 [Candida maltosa Xu316]
MFSSTSGERVIAFENGQTIEIKRSSLKQQDRIAKLTNFYFRNNHLSKQHAKIRYDESTGFHVTDTHSTFGTIVNNEQVLIPGVEFTLKNEDNLGFIMSKPSSQIRKVFQSFQNDEELNFIPIKEFGNPQISLNFKVEINGSVLKLIPLDSNTNNTVTKALTDDGKLLSDAKSSFSEDEEEDDDDEVEDDSFTANGFTGLSIEDTTKTTHSDAEDVIEGPICFSEPEHEVKLDEKEDIEIQVPQTAPSSDKEEDSFGDNVIIYTNEVEILTDEDEKEDDDEEEDDKLGEEEAQTKSNDSFFDRETDEESSDEAPSESEIIYDVETETEEKPYVPILRRFGCIINKEEPVDDDNEEFIIENSNDEELDDICPCDYGCEECEGSSHIYDEEDYDHFYEEDYDDKDSDYCKEDGSCYCREHRRLLAQDGIHPDYYKEETISDWDVEEGDEEEDVEDEEMDEDEDEDEEQVNEDSHDSNETIVFDDDDIMTSYNDGVISVIKITPSKKRSFDEFYDDTTLDDDTFDSDSTEPPRKKIATPESKWKTISKEIGKGIFYILATITALGIYGSTITADED